MYDIIVIGGGPAGLTAALYGARAGKKTLVLEGETPGGQISFAPRVDNYPGLPGMNGAKFGQTLCAQARELGAEYRNEEATLVEPAGPLFEVTTRKGKYTALSVVLATGVTPRKLGLPGEDGLIGQGLSYCAVCDGAFYQGAPVAVVGGGDTALQDALFLSERCSEVTVIHRRSEFRGAQSLQDQLRERGNVHYLMNCTVEKLNAGPEGLRGLIVRNKETGAEQELSVEGLFVAVGNEPRKKIFSGGPSTDSAGYLLAREDCTTDCPGVFAAGDCRVKTVRQVTTAVCDGALAGLAACSYVDGHRPGQAKG